MLNNHAYNLMNQMVVEHKSLWRIKNMYKKDAGDCTACTAFWEKMEQDKEGYTRELAKLIQDHLNA